MIITPKLSSVIGENIQGPSVIKSPSWLDNKLGKYLLYFADHKGNNIKLAHSDDLFGPWKIYEKGTLKLSESLFLNEKPTIPYDYENIKLGSMNNPSGYEPHPDQVSAIPDRLDDMTIPHIASPDVHIDNKNREINNNITDKIYIFSRGNVELKLGLTSAYSFTEFAKKPNGNKTNPATKT